MHKNFGTEMNRQKSGGTIINISSDLVLFLQITESIKKIMLNLYHTL